MRPHLPCYWAAKNAWFVEVGDTTTTSASTSTP
jgi:hypothetical protein